MEPDAALKSQSHICFAFACGVRSSFVSAVFAVSGWSLSETDDALDDWAQSRALVDPVQYLIIRANALDPIVTLAFLKLE